MMGRQSGQISMLILDIEEMIPENHLLRKINQLVSFDFIYDIAVPYILAMDVHLPILSVCLKCCWWDTYTVSSQSVGLSKKSKHCVSLVLRFRARREDTRSFYVQ